MFYKDKIKVLQVLPSLNSGGVERGTIEIAKALSSRGYISYIVSSGGRMLESLHDENIIHINLNAKSKNPLVIIFNIFKLIQIIKKFNINIIHARSRAPAWSAYFAARVSKVKFVTTFHGVYNYNNFLKKFYNSIMTKSDKIIAVSNHVKSHIINNYHKRNIELIYRGVDLKYFNPGNLNKPEIENFRLNLGFEFELPIILLPSRITRWKGHLYLIEIISKLNKKINCLIVGDCKVNDNYMTEINDLIRSYNLEKHVKFLPNQANMPLLYMGCDIVISTSLEPEAFGRTIIEAQAMEKLVIATNIGGAAETIIDNQTGFLAPLNDADQFAKIIHYILEMNMEKKNEIMKNARLHVQDKFSLENMTSNTINLYETLVS